MSKYDDDDDDRGYGRYRDDPPRRSSGRYGAGGHSAYDRRGSDSRRRAEDRYAAADGDSFADVGMPPPAPRLESMDSIAICDVYLECRDGRSRGIKFAITSDSSTVGARSSCDVHLRDEPGVSRDHGLIEKTPVFQHLVYTDTSRHGSTIVDGDTGRRHDLRKGATRVLRLGDTLCLGDDCRLRVRATPQGEKRLRECYEAGRTFDYQTDSTLKLKRASSKKERYDRY